MAEFSTIPAQSQCLSTGTIGRLEDTLNPAVRAAPTPARSLHTTMAETPGAFHQAVEVATAVEADSTAVVEADSTAAAVVVVVVVVAGERRLVMSPVA
jgi:hypothetical protein